MGWKKPILTDSGGYQVMSLSRRCVVDDNGVTFQSPLDGSERMLTPENVVAIQAQLGSDVAMVLDVCVANPADRTTAEAALARTQEWAERSRPLVDDLPGGMFGIVQGSIYPDLRHSHAQQLSALDFPGYAIGGLSVGEPKEVTWEVLEAAVEGLPDDKPHYVMGMGTPLDLVEAVSRGADLFDCVMPTRHARNGVAFTGKGKISIKNSAYAEDPEPLDSNCACPTCRRYSRAYLRHLKMRSEMSGAILLTWHNLFHYLDSMRRIRHAIASGSLTDLLAEVRAAEEEMP
jgi:queuine tRNA-ribosyltransferase